MFISSVAEPKVVFISIVAEPNVVFLQFGAGGRQGEDNWASGAGADAGDDENWD